MSEVQAGEGAEVEQKVAPEADSQSSTITPEADSTSNDTTEKDVAIESPEGSPQKDADWYEAQIKNLKAESARKRDKIKTEREKREKAEARLKELEESRPKQDDFGDYDAYQRADQEHALKRVLAEERLRETSEVVETPQPADPIQQANEAYVEVVKGYFGKEGAVSQAAYQNKEAIFNDALMNRTPDEQATIIRELARMDNAAEVVMNVADNPQALYELATEPSLFRVASALQSAKPAVRQSVDAPPPVPEVDGSTGSLDGYDMDTIEGVRAWKKANGLR